MESKFLKETKKEDVVIADHLNKFGNLKDVQT